MNDDTISIRKYLNPSVQNAEPKYVIESWRHYSACRLLKGDIELTKDEIIQLYPKLKTIIDQ
jgi:hypothetical protein